MGASQIENHHLEWEKLAIAVLCLRTLFCFFEDVDFNSLK